MVGVRRALAERHPWLPAAVLKAFTQAKAVALARLGDTAATKVTLPFVEEQLAAARDLMGEDYWSYGLAANIVHAGGLPAPPPRPGPLPAPPVAGRAVPPLDARDGEGVSVGGGPKKVASWPHETRECRCGRRW